MPQQSIVQVASTCRGFGMRGKEDAGQVYHLLASGQQSGRFLRPAESFDGVYFVGQSWVSVWVFGMGDGNNGVVLVDALNNPGRRQGRGASGPGRVRVQGLRHQGRLISITHEHADHDGGLRYLQDTVGMPAYATKTRNGKLPRPSSWTIARSIWRASTAATRSRRRPRPWASRLRLSTKFAAKTEKGADVPMSCHETQGNSICDFDVMAAGAAATNSFVIGTRVYVRYLMTMSLCVRVKVASDEQGAAAAG
ncbi:hypothetical protein MCOR02_011746 [Pyricularia oryzae]|nr:hypothetical protein MCOR02_011746 [Pyricularia oryzae]